MDTFFHWISSKDCPWPLNLLTLVAVLALGIRIWNKNTFSQTDLILFAWSVWTAIVNIEELLKKVGEK